MAALGVFSQKTGFGTKMGFGTFFSLVNSFPHVDTVKIGSVSEGAPSSGQLP